MKESLQIIEQYTILLDRTIAHHDRLSLLPFSSCNDLFLSFLQGRICKIRSYLLFLSNSGRSASLLSPVIGGSTS